MTTSQRRRPRNRVAMSPLLRKGGVHERSKSGQRAENKLLLNAELDDWREELEEDFFNINHSRPDAGNGFIFHFRKIVTHLVKIVS